MSLHYSTNVINQSTKRRMCDDELDDSSCVMDQGTKRLNDLPQLFNPNNKEIKSTTLPLPSLTYASPDYRPLPRADALWLQPVPQPVLPTPISSSSSTSSLSSTCIQPQPQHHQAMEDDSTDDDDTLPTPSYQPHLQHHHHQQQQQPTTAKQPSVDVDWMMTDQC